MFFFYKNNINESLEHLHQCSICDPANMFLTNEGSLVTYLSFFLSFFVPNHFAPPNLACFNFSSSNNVHLQAHIHFQALVPVLLKVSLTERRNGNGFLDRNLAGLPKFRVSTQTLNPKPLEVFYHYRKTRKQTAHEILHNATHSESIIPGYIIICHDCNLQECGFTYYIMLSILTIIPECNLLVCLHL